jgi:HSP20 family molecular chaperone IbpA
MSLFPHFHAIRQDLLQLFQDIERDLGLETFPATEAGRRLQSEQQQQKPQQITSGQSKEDVGTTSRSGKQQQGTQVATQGKQDTQVSTEQFNQPLAANFKIQEENDKLVATGEFPGVRPEDLKVSVHNGMITLDAKRNIAKEKKTEQSYSYSASSERVARTIPLPQGVDESKVETSFQDGKLKLILGKAAHAMQSAEQQRASEKQQQGAGNVSEQQKAKHHTKA